MKFIECNIPTVVFQPVYEVNNLNRVSDVSCTPVVAWGIVDGTLTPVTCMGVVYSDYIIKHKNSDVFYCPDVCEEFMYWVINQRDGGRYLSSPDLYPDLIIQKFQLMRDRKL